MSPRPIVLASTAAHRAALLAHLELPFTSVPHRFDERREDEHFTKLGPEAFALRLAEGKARSLVHAHPRAWILAADQVAVLGEGDGARLLNKPQTLVAAVEQLMSMAGQQHRLITAVALFDTLEGRLLHEVDRQVLTMRTFSTAEARAYVERYRPLDCAGSYRIEDAGIKLFEAIEGDDHTGIIGLPLLAVCRLFRKVGLLT